MNKLLLLFLLVCIVGFKPINTVKFKVWYVSIKDGSDKNSGTIDALFKTIQHAANLMKPGQKCMIRGGRYKETITITKSGSFSNPLFLWL